MLAIISDDDYTIPQNLLQHYAKCLVKIIFRTCSFAGTHEKAINKYKFNNAECSSLHWWFNSTLWI